MWKCVCRRLQILYLFNVCVNTDGSEKFSDNSPGAASVTSFESTEFANDFAGLSFEEQERLRAEWNQVSLTILIITAILIDLFTPTFCIGTFACRRRDHDSANGSDIQDAFGRRAKAQTWHHRLEGDQRRHEPRHQDSARVDGLPKNGLGHFDDCRKDNIHLWRSDQWACVETDADEEVRFVSIAGGESRSCLQ